MTGENRSVPGQRQGIKLYADTTPRRARQVIADLLMVAWIALCVWLGRTAAEGIEALRAPADGLASAGDSTRDNMSGAASNVGGGSRHRRLAARVLRRGLSAGPGHRQRRNVSRRDG